MGNKPGRPNKVTNEMQEIVLHLLRDHPKWSWTAIYNQAKPLLTQLIAKDIRKEHKDWTDAQVNDEIPERTPKSDAIRKSFKDKSSKKRITPEQLTKRIDDDPGNRSWNMGNLVSADLPASALSVLLKIQELRQKKSQGPLTIREAWWAAHLCETIKTTKVEPRVQVIDYWARIYAGDHRLADVLGHELDTTKLDNILRNNAEAYSTYHFQWDTVEREKGFEATAQLFSDLLDQQAIVRSNHLEPESQESLTALPSQELEKELEKRVKNIAKAREALQKEEEIWTTIDSITDKAVGETLQKTVTMIDTNPSFRDHMLEAHGQEYLDRVKNNLAEVKKRIKGKKEETSHEGKHTSQEQEQNNVGDSSLHRTRPGWEGYGRKLNRPE